MGRLAGDAGFLALAGVVCFTAANAAATPAPTLFRLSVRGTAHQEWDYTGAPFTQDECERTVRSQGVRDVRFRTTRPAILRVVGRRMLPATLRTLAGTATLVGSNTTTDVCGAERRTAIADCVRTVRSFRGAAIAALSSRPGSLTLVGPLNVRLRAVTCPREPADVLSSPLGPLPSPLRVAPATLANVRTRQVTLTASASRRKRYGAPEQGTLEQRSDWTLTLTRVR